MQPGAHTFYNIRVRISQHFVFRPDEGSCINYRNVGKFLTCFYVFTASRAWLKFAYRSPGASEAQRCSNVLHLLLAKSIVHLQQGFLNGGSRSESGLLDGEGRISSASRSILLTEVFISKSNAFSRVAVTLSRLLHVSKVGQSKKGKTKQATVISDFHADGSESSLWPIRLARS